ncbi:YDG/SRA domain-containing protein [Colwellia sp. 20A7]|uniref:YDG/SRA domain-containing protein n=1 Tax=Colwellia sp. 20A7 TaxID=2689569 RepID=UPI0013577857|nr:YDG/SRA domain-containing protein [Colwellia sp. 20A7]
MVSRPIIFGDIDGIKEDDWIANRKDMMPTSFHRNHGQGIDGNGSEGTSAIVLSGGYEDDEDFGDEIIYTGAGGNDPKTGNQIADQSWEKSGNAGLLVSMDRGLPIRVIRGHQHKSDYSPLKGYNYAGLYSVVDAWEEVGRSGFKICRFRLEYCGLNGIRRTPEQVELGYENKKANRKAGTVLRIVRDTKISQDIKKLYKFECQVCGTALKTKKGLYAEGAHIRALGRPHNGDDRKNNLLCLCPNHHVMYDKGSFSIADNFELIGDESGQLFVHAKHKINLENLTYHRKCHGYN